MYFDAIDSILNTRPDIKLVVVDGRSTDSVREHLQKHIEANPDYNLWFLPEKTSQWLILNDVYKLYSTPETKYFVYTSSDVIWLQDWIGEAIKEFEKNPKLQILFPCVSCGDPNLPCQIASGPRDIDPFKPPYQTAAKAPVLNAYAMIFRMDFLRKYDGYPNLFRNCYTESFLHYLCEAIGGEMRVMPRGWCFHWGEGDKWTSPNSAYYYTEEYALFQETMSNLKLAQGLGALTPEFLKKLLWKSE